MTKEEALDAIWMRCQHNDKTFEAYCVLKRELGLNELEPCGDAISRQAVEVRLEENPNKWMGADVLDKIRAEIADIYCGQYCENPFTADAVREMALEIIDKYTAESEE